MSDVKHYYKKKLVNNNIEVEYNSEEDEITITLEHRLHNGNHISTDRMRIHPSYIEPLTNLLREVMKNDE